MSYESPKICGWGTWDDGISSSFDIIYLQLRAKGNFMFYFTLLASFFCFLLLCSIMIDDRSVVEGWKMTEYTFLKILVSGLASWRSQSTIFYHCNLYKYFLLFWSRLHSCAFNNPSSFITMRQISERLCTQRILPQAFNLTLQPSASKPKTTTPVHCDETPLASKFSSIAPSYPTNDECKSFKYYPHKSSDTSLAAGLRPPSHMSWAYGVVTYSRFVLV